MEYSKDLLTGYRVSSQGPLDEKPYFLTKAEAADFGTNNNKAFSYYKGMFSYCAETDSFYVWNERLLDDETPTLLENDFQYPEGVQSNGIDYSNKIFNFFLFKSGEPGEVGVKKYTFSFTTQFSGGKTLGKYPTNSLVEVVDKTIPEIFQQIGQEIINPTLINPTFSISLPNYTQKEVGSTYSELMTATFNRGQIKGKLVAGVWQENTQQDFRAGVASTYTLDGSLQVGSTKTISKVLDLGDNVFSGSVNFLTGVQPTNSAGGNFDSPYAPGTLSDSKIIRAAYPVFYGTLNIGQTILDINLSAFTKVTNINPNNTVSIPYSNVLGKQLVILIPIENTIKTKWYVTESNKGGIDGITGDLFALPVTASYNSPTLLWLGKSYRVYISTPTSINTTIELRN